MQMCLPLLVIVSILYAVYGCDPLIQSDQSLYCDAQFVFVGIVKYAKVTRDEAIFRIRVTSNLKGQIGYSGKTVTVFGSGLFDSCGPPSFKVNKKYILTVSKYSTPNRMMLGTYYEPTTANLNRFKKYDCSCKVEVNIPEQPFFGEPAPIGDKCVITEREYNCHFDEGYCARRPSDSYGPRSPCQWVAPTTPCPQ